MTDDKNNKDGRLEDPKGSDGTLKVEDNNQDIQSASDIDNESTHPFYSDTLDSDSQAGVQVDSNPTDKTDPPEDELSAREGASEEGWGNPSESPTQEEDSEEPKTSKKKGGKKEKTPKAAAAKTAKKPKVKKAKKDKPASNTDNPVGFYWLWFALTVAFLGFVDAVAYKQAGPDSFLFIGVFDGLGLLLLSVPLALIGGSRKFQYSLTDIFLALAAFFAVLSCLAILTCQAQYYGASAKVAALITSVTTTFYV
ncbi:MAG: hypothetical protein Q4G03_04665 [Planctomycetia bacterium]|nr:hypothetical protein [Planctomycetia bacterium]